MIGDLFSRLLDSLAFIWPLKIVDQWERAGVYAGGKWKEEVGAGMHLLCPWYHHLEPVSIAPELVGTGRQDITLSDGRTLSFSAVATLRVTDVNRALNSIGSYKESTQELIGSYLAEQLADADADRLSPARRGRFFAGLVKGLAAEASEMGVEVTKLRFTSFVVNVRTVRLLMEQGTPIPW